MRRKEQYASNVYGNDVMTNLELPHMILIQHKESALHIRIENDYLMHVEETINYLYVLFQLAQVFSIETHLY
jgi:hypothetical protein